MFYNVLVYYPHPKTGEIVEKTRRIEAEDAVGACCLAAPGFVRRGPFTRRTFLPDNAHFQRNESGTKGVCAVALIPFVPVAR